MSYMYVNAWGELRKILQCMPPKVMAITDIRQIPFIVESIRITTIGKEWMSTTNPQHHMTIGIYKWTKIDCKIVFGIS